ncbi:MAG: hypothetical protein NC336_09885 [Clostridium sp.]|nr:hypothetical protein [Clostridium sp.]
MRIQVIVILICAILGGCISRNNTSRQVDQTLASAGENAPELLRVLEHYADSAEKLEAARWLIANMQYHYCYDSPLIDSVEADLAPLGERSDLVLTIGEENLEKWRRRDIFSAPKLYDHLQITAPYLIDNIDRAFRQWRKRPWNKDLTFEKFCELILPYRIGDERLTPWRQVYEEKFASRLDSAMTERTTLFDACRMVYEWATEVGGRYNDEIRSPHRDALSLLESPVSNCRDDCDEYVFVMRACGIPAIPHHLLCSPDNATSHQWVAVYNPSTGRFHPFGYDGMELSDSVLTYDHRTKGKIYQVGYEPNFRRLQQIERNHYPKTEKTANPFLSDMTANYYGPNCAEVDIIPGTSAVALGVYARRRYHMIDFGSVSGQKKARFADIEPGIIYFPLNAVSGQPCGQPFLLIPQGKVVQFSPESDHKETVRLSRKMPLTTRNRMWLDSLMVGTRIMAGTDTILRVETPFRTNYRRYELPEPVKARQLTILPPDNQPLSVAELILTGASGDTIRYTVSGNTRSNPSALNDGDILSLFFTPRGEPAELTLEKASEISAITIIPRNDDNFVWPGQTYELLLFADGAWRSCDRKTAADRHIDFDCPVGGVYLLRNLTKGVEEQVFIVCDGRPLFSLDIAETLHPRGLMTHDIRLSFDH